MATLHGLVGRAALACATGAALLASALPLEAQDRPELITDRPDATESAVTVPRGSLQMEFGTLWLLDRPADTRLTALETPGTLVRLGLLEQIELRLAWSGWGQTIVEDRGGRIRTAGVADPELGAKWHVVGHRGTDVALIGHVTLPVGDEAVGARAADPSLVLAVAHDLGSRVGFGWNTGYSVVTVNHPDGDMRTLGRWTYSGSLAVELAPRWGTFVEVFGDVAGSDPGPTAHVVQSGVTWRPGPLVQIDVAVGTGLNADAPDRLATLGFSFRWLK